MVERLGKRDASEESFRGRRNSAAEDGALKILGVHDDRPGYQSI